MSWLNKFPPMNMPRRRWIISQSDRSQAERLAGELGLLPAVAAVLLNRGLDTADQARAFLSPGLEQLLSPWKMKGMERAVSRIVKALERGEKVAVHGDYDADGITAAVILVEALRQLGGQVDFYLPSRFREGYGLHREALEQLHAAGFSLVITVDCGITAAEEVAFAAALGLEVIITDHHRPLGPLPEAVAVLNPLQDGCGYLCKELSGAGIAFKLACALMERCAAAFPASLLDLAALGTVADMVPLLGENRTLACLGLAELNLRRRVGLNALARVCGLKERPLDSTGVAFILAPSLNAAGRMGDACPAAQLLLEKDGQRAESLAAQLHRDNRMRRATEARIIDEAENALRDDPGLAGRKVITLAGKGWHHGVIGIAATRLVERFYRPVVLISLEEDGAGRGSARSIPGFDITAALARCAGLLERFGGHAGAAGFSIAAAGVTGLGEALDRIASRSLPEEAFIPCLKLEGELAAEEITAALAGQLALLQPFGMENPVPLFLSRRWELRSWRPVGQDKKHLKLNLEQQRQSLSPIFFSASSLAPRLMRGRRADLVFTMENGSFNGEAVLNVELKDIAYADSRSSGIIEVVDRRGERGSLAYLRELLKEGRLPPAVFIATRERKERLLSRLPGGQGICFLTSGKAEDGLADAGWPGELVLYDLPLHIRLLAPFFRAERGVDKLRVHLLYDQRSRKLNEELIALALPTEEVLAEIRRAAAETAAGCPLEKFPGFLRQSLNYNAGDSFWRRSLQILLESGALSQKESGAFVLGEEGAAWLARLAQSPAYAEALELREQSRRFQELLLNGSGEEIARFLDDYCRGGAAKL